MGSSVATTALSSINNKSYRNLPLHKAPLISPSDKRHWTYDDYYNLNDGKRYEVIEGELVMMTPAPLYSHQKAAARLVRLILNHVYEKNIGEALFAPVDVVLSSDIVLQPDILFISNENSGRIKDAGIFGPPDLAVEILSPSSIHRDMEVKKSIYERFGVKEYWIVFPGEAVMEIFALKDGKYELSSSSEEVGKVESAVLGMELDTADVF